IQPVYWREAFVRFVHLSDLHIGKSNNLEKTNLLVDWILKNKKIHQSGIVLITGDLVDDGETWQFYHGKEVIERLRNNGYKVLVIPGNHDYGQNGIRESIHSQTDFIELISGIREYPAVFMQDGQAILLLDSMAGEIGTLEFWGAQGYLGEEQLQKLDLLLDELAENEAVENVVLALHHHPFDYLFYHGLRDNADLKGVISRSLYGPPRVNVLLFGHKHLERRFNDPDDNKEELFGIDLIYASGQSIERNMEGKMVLPVIDLIEKTVERYFV
ncbi:MAG: metallophosphoesterase, partial [Anaerolineales bacterium]|nr:metallophosphoesterase [Anaerolineales bacterium]